MDHPILVTSGLLTIILGMATFSCYFRKWSSIKSSRLVWRNTYPSFEELHALFDRGDIMLSTVLIASAMQLSHPELAKVIGTHSSYRTDPWRRVMRTLAFIYIMIRSNSSERQKVIAWLRKLHKPIPLYVFETNTLVLATFAYGLVKTHEFIGSPTMGQKNGIVAAVLNLADKLDPNDRGRKVPNTMAELTEYLRENLSLDTNEVLNIYCRELTWLGNTHQELRTQGTFKFLIMPLQSIKMLIYKSYVYTLSERALAQSGARPESAQGNVETAMWWCVRKLHCLLSYFHYSLCPPMLTFNGTMELLATGNPELKNVATDLYCEIFGSENDALRVDLPGKTRRNFSDMEAHLPTIQAQQRLRPPVAGFFEEVAELLKCARYRGQLALSIGHEPQHLGIIMDGNRRYSRHRKLHSIVTGHEAGAHKLIQVISWAFSSGIQNLTVWALSDDNLKRGPQELDPLFSMMTEYIREMIVGDAPFHIPDIRFRVVGDRSILPSSLNHVIDEAEAATAENSKFSLQIAIGYGGRAEIARATKLAVKHKMKWECLSLQDAIDSITEADISRHTYSARLGLPQIDAIVRTSGEKRLSGFALWESCHAEFAIVEENWPALRQSTFLRTILDFSKRCRRLGA